MEECEVSSKRDGGRMERPLRVIVGGEGVGGGVGGGFGGRMMGRELVDGREGVGSIMGGGRETMGGISKETEGGGSGGVISHGCSNASGNVTEGGCDAGR